jgi:hypothetical protein
MPNEEFLNQIRKGLALDEAMGKLQEAGLADAFVKAIEKDRELRGAIEKITPEQGVAASPGWSCCVTVQKPL